MSAEKRRHAVTHGSGHVVVGDRCQEHLREKDAEWARIFSDAGERGAIKGCRAWAVDVGTRFRGRARCPGSGRGD